MVSYEAVRRIPKGSIAVLAFVPPVAEHINPVRLV